MLNKEPKILLSRRGFILQTLNGHVALPFALSLESKMNQLFRNSSIEEAIYLSSANSGDSSYILGIDLSGKIHFRTNVSVRCHGISKNPKLPSQVVVYPKRPGYLAYVLDTNTGEILKEFSTQTGRYFYGHGTFSSDGNFLYSSENDFNLKRGLISVRETNNFKVVDEIPSGGLGPHDIINIPGSIYIGIANGGIFEHPTEGDARKKLNISSMDPSLAIIDPLNKSILEVIKPKDHLLGIRHLSIEQDKIFSAIQYEGQDLINSPLVSVTKGSTLEFYLLPKELQLKAKGYALSIATSPSIVGVSFSKGDFVGFWDTRTKKYLGTFNIKGPGGVSLSHDKTSFIISAENGEVHSILESKISTSETGIIRDSKLIYSSSDMLWDNHIKAI